MDLTKIITDNDNSILPYKSSSSQNYHVYIINYLSFFCLFCSYRYQFHDQWHKTVNCLCCLVYLATCGRWLTEWDKHKVNCEKDRLSTVWMVVSRYGCGQVTFVLLPLIPVCCLLVAMVTVWRKALPGCE